MASPEEPRPATSTTNASNNENIIEDELDDLFNYEPGSADVFRAIDTNMDASPHIAADGAGTKRKRDNIAGGDGLGIDEEVKVRTRVPTLKLDEDLLLSDKGIPRLRKLAKKQLRLKGKGHEFSDVARLLAFYQLWLDDLFPKARFADGLEIIEKLGHSRRLQVMRREWIDGEKSYGGNGGGDYGGKTQVVEVDDAETQEGTGQARDPIQVDGDRGQERSNDPGGRGPEEDLYSATPRAFRRGGAPTGNETNDQPDEDELDGLFVGTVNGGSAGTSQTRGGKESSDRGSIEEDDEDEDELDALFSSAIRNGPSRQPHPVNFGEKSGSGGPKGSRMDEDQEDDLDALLAEDVARAKSSSSMDHSSMASAAATAPA